MINDLSSLWGLIDQRVGESPDAPMLSDEQGRSLSFEQFRAACEETAAGLAERGVGSGSTVSWQLPTTIEANVLIGAIARLDATQNPIIPILRRREVGFMLGQTGATHFVAPSVLRGFDHGALARELESDLGATAIVCDGTPQGSFGLDLPAGDPSKLPPATVAGGEPPVRWIYYTSGTTADPKGARHTDVSVLAASNGFCLVGDIRAADTIACPIPVSHIGGVMVLATVLRSGCNILLLDSFDPVRTPELVAAHGTSLLFAVVPMYPPFLDAAAKADEPLLANLRYCCNGGATVPLRLHRQVKQELGGIGVLSSWGLTESPADTFPPLDTDDVRMASTVGCAVPGTDVRVVGDDGRPCPPGVDGELRVRGPQLFQGYVDSSLDADAFDRDGFLRTGDLGQIDVDGYVSVTGRLKDVIIRNGENISAQEVEQVLLGHPSIADVAVIGVPDERTGERCCAIIQLADGAAEVTLADLGTHCREAGLATQKTPERIELVDAIPRNALGKPQKQELRKRFT